MASRRITDLHPVLFPLAIEFTARAHEQGIDVLIYCTYRSGEEQDELYKIGRSLPGRRVTNAKAGQSSHNVTFQGRPGALAFDCVPICRGKARWNDLATYKRLGTIAAGLGLTWGGNWKMRDLSHFEMPEWKQIAQKAG